MQTVRTEQQVIDVKIHNFHCDSCKKFIGSSTEDWNGNFDYKGYIELELFSDYPRKRTCEQTMGCLCEACYKKLLGAINEIFPIETAYDEMEENENSQ